jgi:hypothetical protein
MQLMMILGWCANTEKYLFQHIKIFEPEPVVELHATPLTSLLLCCQSAYGHLPCLGP